MPLIAAPRAGPDSRAHLETLGLTDPNRYVTIRGFPVLDSHPPITKRVRDPNAISLDNPDGVVEQTLEVTRDDLARMAANTNAQVAIGRLPTLQIGHTPLEDRPEEWHPKPVGLTSHYSVCERDGRPWLCCDLHYRRDLLGEASTYPNLSVERIDWRDPNSTRIDAVAILRREPERQVPLVPYQAERPLQATMLACYGRDVPFTPSTEKRKMALEPEDITMIGTMITDAVTAALHAAKPGTEPGDHDDPLKPAEPEPEPEPAANYDGESGSNTGYIPDEKNMNKEVATMAKSCYAAAKKVPGLQGQVSSLVTLTKTLQTDLVTATARLNALASDAEDNQSRLMRSNYERIISEAIDHGTIVSDDEREELLDTVYALPEANREPRLRKILANYAQSYMGDRMIPGHTPPVKGQGKDMALVNWMSRRGLVGDEGRKAYAAAQARGEV